MWNSLITRIFEEVFFHRSKDSNDEVRCTCVTHLKALIIFDVDKNIKTEYLKYLARAFYDSSNYIRLEAVRILEELVDVRPSITYLFFPLNLCRTIKLSLISYLLCSATWTDLLKLPVGT